jgi:hypothetical protein
MVLSRFHGRLRPQYRCFIRLAGVVSLTGIFSGCVWEESSAPAVVPGAAAVSGQVDGPRVDVAATPGGAPTVSGAPTISGKPAAAVTAGYTFSFLPSARDSDGSALTFSIANRPAWATFNSTTGRLSGSPTANDVGTYANITISVTDGSSTASLAPFNVDVLGTASGSIVVNWIPPSQRADGTALLNLAGYRIFWGTAEDDFPNEITIDNPGVLSYVVDQLPAGTYYVVATAFDAQTLESSFSEVTVKTVPGVTGT